MVPAESGIAERRGVIAFAGSMITRGRGRGIVTATGITTEIGKIAEEIGKRSMITAATDDSNGAVCANDRDRGRCRDPCFSLPSDRCAEWRSGISS